MTKALLSDDPDGGWGHVRLDDDYGAYVVADVHARMTVWRRAVTGVDQHGNRVYSWEQVASDVHVAMYEDRVEVEDGVELLKVKLVALHEFDMEPTASMALSFGEDEDPTETKLVRITSVFQNGVRTEIVGERVLSG